MAVYILNNHLVDDVVDKICLLAHKANSKVMFKEMNERQTLFEKAILSKEDPLLYLEDYHNAQIMFDVWIDWLTIYVRLGNNRFIMINKFKDYPKEQSIVEAYIEDKKIKIERLIYQREDDAPCASLQEVVAKYSDLIHIAPYQFACDKLFGTPLLPIDYKYDSGHAWKNVDAIWNFFAEYDRR